MKENVPSHSDYLNSKCSSEGNSKREDSIRYQQVNSLGPGAVGAVGSFPTHRTSSSHPRKPLEGKFSPVPMGCCSSVLPSRYACLILKQLYSCTTTMPAHPSPMKPPKNDSQQTEAYLLSVHYHNHN